MTKNYLVLFAFGTMIFSVGCYINNYAFLGTALAIVSIFILLFTAYVYSAKFRTECVFFLIAECILMFFDRSIPGIVHVEFIFFSSLAYSVLCVEKRNEMVFSIKVGLLTVLSLFTLMLLQNLFIKLFYGVSASAFTSYLPVMISILLVWLFSYTKKFILKRR